MIDKMLRVEEMTPEQKLGRVLCARRFNTQDDIDFTMELVKNEACGCLQMPFNAKTKELIDMYRAAANYPLIVVNDMEVGFPLSTLPKIPLISLAACDNSEYNRVFAAALAKEAKEMGYSGCWGPIVDILHCNAPCTVSRTSSDTPEGAYHFAKDINEVFKTYAFHGCAKHYPGSNVGPIDTHMIEGVSYETKEDLINYNLLPYKYLMNDGLLPSLMVGHQVLKNIDPDRPASLSKKVIDIIREMGFDGVVYTDSLAMMGILQKFGEENAMWMALMAGNDIILPNYRTTTREVYEMMLRAYKEGKITDERLDEAVRRIMVLEEYCARVPENPYPVPENVEEVIKNISRDCISADCEEGFTPAISTEGKKLFVVLTPMDFVEGDVGAEISLGDWYNANRVIKAIKERFPNDDIFTMHEFPRRIENENVLNTATKYEDVVMVTFCTTSAYMGSDELTKRIEKVIEALAAPGKLKALVHFGNPLAISWMKGIPRKIYGYNSPDSQVHAFDVLNGTIPARGKNPFPNVTKKM